MTEWFYVKNDLKSREDIKKIIMHPIWQRFSLRRPKVEMDESAEECQRAFGVVCSFIGTRDLVQEHIAFRVWPLAEKWEMPQETIKETDEGGLVRLKYTFKFGDKFVEPDDDWLKSIETVSDELLGVYSKAEDTALSAAFGGRRKKRLNRVFDAVGFVYPDYRYPVRGQKRKGTTSVKETAAAAPSEPAPKRKRVKVLTHRPRYIEPATVPEFTGETSSATEAKEPTLLSEVEELAEVPVTGKLEEPKTLLPEIKGLAEVPATGKLEEPKILLPEIKGLAEVPAIEKMEEPGTEKAKTSEVLSPSAKIEAGKSQKGPTVTPKRKRMVNVLDVLETIKSSSITPKKTVETSEVSTKAIGTEASKQQFETEAGPSEAAKVKPFETEETNIAEATEEIKISEPILVEETDTGAPEAPSKIYDYIVRHASGKKLSEEEIFEANHYARELKYPKGALVFNGTDEDDLLYCLPDNKELSVCREMGRSMGFPKLEAGLCAMTKEDLADSLAYNSLKVQELRVWKFYDLKPILLFLYQLFYI
jgi:hypothetical protein